MVDSQMKEVVTMLGARIAVLRKAAGLSQSDLAQRLRISPSAVGMYEQGRREPSADTLVALGQIFHVTVDFLLTGRAVTREESRHLEELLQQTLDAVDTKLQHRCGRSFSRQEVALLLAALLTEP